MAFALAGQHRFHGLGVADQGKGGVFLDQLGEGFGHAHVVVARLGRDRQPVHRRPRLQPGRAVQRLAFERQELAGVDVLQLADGHDLAVVGRRHLGLARPLDLEQTANPAAIAAGEGEFGAVGYAAAQHPGVGQHAGLAAIGAFEHIGAGAVGAQAFARAVDRNDLMTQRLEQSPHAKALGRRAKEHRHDQAVVELTHQVGEHRVGARSLVGQQLLQQCVVEIGQLLQHVEARVRLLGRHRHGQVDALGRLALAVFEGALQRQVDKAGDVAAAQDRQLPRHRRRAGNGVERLEQFRQRTPGLVDLVDEHDPRHAQGFQRL